jgi:hypothetical protein
MLTTFLLERIGGQEATAILEGLIYGVPDFDVIAETRAALERLK